MSSGELVLQALVLFNALAVTALICKQAWEQCQPNNQPCIVARLLYG